MPVKDVYGDDDDDSLMVYSNSQQILAYANFFNIKISIFTYTGEEGRWSEVTPDPEMSNHAEFKFGKCVPDIALYHRDETHFDLLVGDDSRLELLGLLAGSVDIEPSEDSNKNGVSEDDWVTVITKKRRGVKHSKIDEELLIENETNHDDLVNIEEEITLMNGKQSGHKRMSPHESLVLGCATVTMLECKQCDSMFHQPQPASLIQQLHRPTQLMFHPPSQEDREDP